MCRIISKSSQGEWRIGDCGCFRRTQGGIRELLLGSGPGDYVMVHAGAAIAKISENEEKEANSLMEELL